MKEDLNPSSEETKFKFVAFSKEGINLIQSLTTKITTKKTKKTSKLTTADINILFYLINNMTYENTSKIPPQKIICSELNISQKQVSISINKLINEKIIIKTPAPRTYFINPKYFYLGKDRKNKIIKWKKMLKNNFD